VLQLIETTPQGTFKFRNEVPILKCYKISTMFSRDGNYFALFRRKLNVLQIYKILNGDLLKLMDDVTNSRFFREYRNYVVLKNAQMLYFDRNSRYLASYGNDAVNIIDIECKAFDQFYQEKTQGNQGAKLKDNE